MKPKFSIVGKNKEGISAENAELWQERLADRVQALKPSGIREFFDIVASRKDVISLGVGEPDFVSPQKVINSTIQALREGYTHYTGNQGLPSVLASVEKYLKREYGLDYEAKDELLLTVGVSQGLDIALRSIVNPGDRVLYTRPCYVSYGPMIELAGGVGVAVPTRYENNFQLGYEDLMRSYQSGAKALLLNYPCNPTGASLSRQSLEDIRKFVLEKDLLVISDEIYGELSYDAPHIPFATLPGMRERTMLLGGMSKSFAMTGWRIAYAAGPHGWLNAMLKIHQYSMLCAPTISQLAAEVAVNECLEERQRMKEAYLERRNTIVTGLNHIGLRCHSPEGAFYVFPRIHTTGFNSLDFARKLLDEQDVAVVPGTAFGPEGEGHVRCSYATSLDEIHIALERIEKFVKNHA